MRVCFVWGFFLCLVFSCFSPLEKHLLLLDVPGDTREEKDLFPAHSKYMAGTKAVKQTFLECLLKRGGKVVCFVN